MLKHPSLQPPPPFTHNSHTLLPTLTGASRASSSVTTSTLPSCAARCSGVIPWRVTVLVGAPYSSSVVVISIWFFLAAMWSGV